MKKNNYKQIVLGIGLALTMPSCFSSKQSGSSSPALYEARENKSLESRIDRTLERRAELVRNNPSYTQLVVELKEAREQLKDRKYEQAFKSFGNILKNRRYLKFPEYSYAKFYLASSMSAMGIQYGALLYYADLVEKEPLRDHTHEALVQAIRLAQHLKDDEVILYLASVIKQDKVPKSLREEFRYYIAKDLYLKKNYKTAVKLLRSISVRNRMYLASQYLLGSMAVATKNFKHAIDFFRGISSQNKLKRYYEGAKIKQLANLALGRVFYEQKNYPLSIVFYKKVERDKEYYPQGLYETSWGLFKMNLFNEALSVLHSVNAPFFEQVFFLKSYLLKGAIFLELCLYDDALKSLTSVEERFEQLGKQIDAFARRAKSPQEYYPLLSSQKMTPDGNKEYTYKDLFNLASANRDFWFLHQYIESLKAERELLKKVGGSRAPIISNLIVQKERELTKRASWLGGRKLLLTKNLIADFFSLRDFLRYEIVSTERKILQTRSLRLAPPVDVNASLIKPEFTESLKESLVWWEYSGEYWEDEVGYYLYDLESICKDKR